MNSVCRAVPLEVSTIAVRCRRISSKVRSLDKDECHDTVEIRWYQRGVLMRWIISYVVVNSVPLERLTVAVIRSGISNECLNLMNM